MTKKEERPWYFDERAQAFVSLALTRNHDVRVRLNDYPGDMNIQLKIEILKDGVQTDRIFGAQLIPYMDLPLLETANENVRGYLCRNRPQDNWPLCAFVVGVRKPEGLYRWLAEPVAGHFQLDRNEQRLREHWYKLDDDGVARLIEKVNAWYDAQEDSIVAAGHRRHRNGAS